MIRYSLQPRDSIFVEDYGFLSFARNMGKNIGKNISENVSCKCNQKVLGHTNQRARVILIMTVTINFTNFTTGTIKK